MDGQTWVALGSLLVAAIALIGTFWDRRRVARQTEADRRRRLLDEMIGRLETVVRLADRPIWLRLGANPELEIALTIPRLAAVATKEEAPLVAWIGLQSKRMQLAPTNRVAVQIAGQVVGELAAWHSGDRSIGWFAAQNASLGDLRARRPRRSLRRQLEPARESFIFSFVLVASVLAPAALFAGAAKLFGWMRTRFF